MYGRGPDDQPYLYVDDQKTFLLGRKLTGAALQKPLEANDLPRSAPPDPGVKLRARAIIGDPRNDENVIVSQLQGLFLRFHNNRVKAMPSRKFEEIQQDVRFHYQWLILTDFLPKLIAADVLHQVVPHLGEHDWNPRLHRPKLEFYHPKNEPFMPLEFSVAAYRFGHSMIRPGYRLNDAISPLPIFVADDTDPNSLGGFEAFPDSWAIDWARFIDIEERPYGDLDNANNPGNPNRTQLAYRIDTSLVNPLGALPARVASDPPPSLAARNLLRGWRLRLPTGQDVARAMGLEPLDDKDILIGKFTGDTNDIVGSIVDAKAGGPAFAGNCPLWTYVLAETHKATVQLKTSDGVKPIETRQLGPVGGRIVAETFVGLLANDSTSFLNRDPLWRPSPNIAPNGVFGLRELVLAALATDVASEEVATPTA